MMVFEFLQTANSANSAMAALLLKAVHLFDLPHIYMIVLQWLTTQVGSYLYQAGSYEDMLF